VALLISALFIPRQGSVVKHFNAKNHPGGFPRDCKEPGAPGSGIFAKGRSLRRVSVTWPSSDPANYAAALTVTGGAPPYTWSIVWGALPDGLSLNPSGLVSGTPTKRGGTFSMIIEIADIAKATATQMFTIEIRSNAPTLTVQGYADGVIQLLVSGDAEPSYTFEVSRPISRTGRTSSPRIRQPARVRTSHFQRCQRRACLGAAWLAISGGPRRLAAAGNGPGVSGQYDPGKGASFSRGNSLQPQMEPGKHGWARSRTALFHSVEPAIKG
jgi:hypothetical protein